MFSNLNKNDCISVHANRSCYDFNRVYFVTQDEDTITVHNFVYDDEVTIPKENILEIQKHVRG
ncbi:hypothetical protein P9B03_04080 [Metasolibacillus meyeri]|uniref:Uncharacterized protein n=1 Tax=Metasolibacillus meyeri TaxID=1071052 RepID=A0AAW9NTX0_9BACL|nr:hypothetical protein [Metasolibacillus meyeri]MEC1177653.1 hypothetical protein [Metasolibacillus meyeri]